MNFVLVSKALVTIVVKRNIPLRLSTNSPFLLTQIEALIPDSSNKVPYFWIMSH